MSARTFQRQLKEEGASFSDLLADVRRSETLKRLTERNLTIAAIATDLGYSDQAAFTRVISTRRRAIQSVPSVPAMDGSSAESVPRGCELKGGRGTDRDRFGAPDLRI